MTLFATLPNRTAALSAMPSATTPRTAPGWIARVKSAIWRSLEEAGRARARRELFALADRYSATRPELANDLRAAADRDMSN